MNPFQKLKLTIDRVGLEYIPSDDYPNITGQTVYKYSKNYQVQDNQHAPYFKTEGPNESFFKHRSTDLINQQAQELRAVYENQHKNLIDEINSLNRKLQNLQKAYTTQSNENQSLRSSLESQQRQNAELRAYILDVEQKSVSKLSQSNVHDRQRKLKQEIDRVNHTVTQLAKDLNAERMGKKNIQRQLENTKMLTLQAQGNMAKQKNRLQKQIIMLTEQLQKRAELLQHSIKSSRDQKIVHKNQLSQTKKSYQLRIQRTRTQLDSSKQEIYNLKIENTQNRYERSSLEKQRDNLEHIHQNVKSQLNISTKKIVEYGQIQRSLKDKIQQSRLQCAYFRQQLEQERSNTKVKVVQVRDQSLQMQLSMYKKQCKQLIKQKSIWISVKKDKSEYTIISQNQIILNRSE